MGRKPASDNDGRITLKDIATALGVAPSTVNKALTGRSGVSDSMRQTILQTASELGYRANRSAQSLSRKAIKIGVIIPSVWPEYHGYLLKGIDLMLSRLQDYRVSAQYYYLTSLYNQEEIAQGVSHMIMQEVDGVILCPNVQWGCTQELEQLAQHEIPVVLLGSDLESHNRLSCVRQDSELAGQLAAEYMQHLLPAGKTAAIMIGNRSITDHQKKIAGFSSIPNVLKNAEADVLEAMDDSNLAFSMTKTLLLQRADIGGIYVATSNCVGVCAAISQLGLGGQCKVIGTDIFPAMRKLFEDELLQGVIFQDPVRQGKLAVQLLFDYLTLGKGCAKETLVFPHMILKSNFPSYLNLILASDASAASL